MTTREADHPPLAGEPNLTPHRRPGQGKQRGEGLEPVTGVVVPRDHPSRDLEFVQPAKEAERRSLSLGGHLRPVEEVARHHYQLNPFGAD